MTNFLVSAGFSGNIDLSRLVALGSSVRPALINRYGSPTLQGIFAPCPHMLELHLNAKIKPPRRRNNHPKPFEKPRDTTG
jgi:hypothetical protein